LLKSPQNATPVNAREMDAPVDARPDQGERPYALGAASYRYKSRAPDSSYQNYLFGKAGSDERPAWSDSTGGRAMIRMLSRGVVGAAFFTIGGRMAQRDMQGYNQHMKPANLLQGIAKGFDMTFGKVLHGTIKQAAAIKIQRVQS